MTTERNDTSDASLHFGVDLLREVFEHGDQRTVGTMLGLPKQHVWDMFNDTRRNPLDAVVILIETLRRNGNARADELFLALARRLDFIAYRESSAGADDIDFAALFREFADVVNARAEAEKDGKVEPRERREIAKQCNEMIEKLACYRDAQIQRATADEARNTNVRRIG